MAAIVDFDTIPQMFNRLHALYAGQGRTVLRYKDRHTKTWVDIDWDELQRQVHAFAGYLHRQGVRPGDRVAILSENRPEWAVTDLATQLLGAVNVALYTTLPASQVEYILKDAGAKLFVTSTSIQLRKAEAVFEACPDLVEVVTMSELRGDHPAYVRPWEAAMDEGAAYWAEHEAELRPLADAVQPDDLSALIYTSGTTGKPKGVMLTHRNFCSNAQASLKHIPFGPEDHHLSFLPLCHSFERTAGYTCVLACGATISYAESIEAVSKNLTEVRPTVMISVPRLFERIYNLIVKSVDEGPAVKKRIFEWAVSTGRKVAERRRNGAGVGPILSAQRALAHRLVFAQLHEKLGGNLRFAVSGGAALPRAIGEFFEAAGITIVEGYGLTETAPVLAANPVDAPRYGTVGHVIPGVTVGIQRVSDGVLLGQLCGDDYPSDLTTDEGEIVARGPNIMKGYWNNETATKEAIDADGWYHTGDIGRFDRGYLMITDRLKHMIVSKGGKNIYPGPIEDLFKTVPWIDQIMVVGEGREYLTALVVPSFEALHRYAREQGIDYTDDADLLTKEPIRQLFANEFRTYSRTAASHEKIRDFRLILEPFTVENGMLTPTLKLRRRVIEIEYADLINEMYEDVV
ncbi:long-chain fatty acid--CoA ligase [Rhodothermaceae bacterium RA]|nr:long-chain fatty acid--CoA ligase [Rhodothermaceae bacterium RA]